MRKPVMSMPPIHISLASQTRSAQASAVMISKRGNDDDAVAFEQAFQCERFDHEARLRVAQLRDC